MSSQGDEGLPTENLAAEQLKKHKAAARP
jgi:hypothetical protein